MLIWSLLILVCLTSSGQVIIRLILNFHFFAKLFTFTLFFFISYFCSVNILNRQVAPVCTLYCLCLLLHKFEVTLCCDHGSSISVCKCLLKICIGFYLSSVSESISWFHSSPIYKFLKHFKTKNNRNDWWDQLGFPMSSSHFTSTDIMKKRTFFMIFVTLENA